MKIKTVSLDFLKGRSNQLQEAAEDNEQSLEECQEIIDSLPSELQERLFEHQRTGVSWLYRLYQSEKGGILGDDMGLGKTCQVVSLLCGLFRMKAIKKALIICPVSVTQSWFREIRDHAKPYVKGLNVDLLVSEMTKKNRERVLREVFMTGRPRIVITTYTLFANMAEHFSLNGKWDYAILDEGHAIKNPSTKLSKAAHSLDSRQRLILSGTPIQNNMMELHALISWVSNGKLLGSKSSFKHDFVEPIL